ncbi:MAG: hypothetical protein AAGG02_15480 [Cyanobacteria bacterium P01_H01_bin.15]
MTITKILAAVSPVLLLSPLLMASVKAQSLNAKCLLQIDVVTYLDERCHYEIGDDTDFFSDLQIVVSCPDGRNVEEAFCAGAVQQVTRAGFFGYLFRTPEGVAELCWNEGVMRRAIPCFEGLTRDGACWSNPQARHRYGTTDQFSNVKLCALAI